MRLNLVALATHSPEKEYRLNAMNKRRRIYITKSIDTIEPPVDQVNREDPWREAAAEARSSGIPSDTSHGIETCFDDVRFVPPNRESHLNSLPVGGFGEQRNLGLAILDLE